MLDQIRSFFEEQRTPFECPEELLLTAETDALRATCRAHWLIARDYLDQMEKTVLELYDAGAEDPAALDFVDKVVAIISQDGKTHNKRIDEILQLTKATEVFQSTLHVAK